MFVRSVKVAASAAILTAISVACASASEAPKDAAIPVTVE